jgi:hypothetical protein
MELTEQISTAIRHLHSLFDSSVMCQLNVQFHLVCMCEQQNWCGPSTGLPSASYAVPQPPVVSYPATGYPAAPSHQSAYPPTAGNWTGGAPGMPPVSVPVFLVYLSIYLRQIICTDVWDCEVGKLVFFLNSSSFMKLVLSLLRQSDTCTDCLLCFNLIEL